MNRDEICAKFLEALTFELYPFQEEALLAWFECSGGVLVCAPTGMGKTLIAEAAIFEALETRRRLYYTTPLIALTDQKFREIQELAVQWGFAREDIGLITGNRRENPDALVRVVVAEILLNHLLSPDPAIADMEHVDAVVMDEFHSFNDFERGVVWELSLVLLPAHVRVMLLSATVGNPQEFAIWMHREHGRDLKLVLSTERRVPLEFIWVGDKLLTEQLPEMVSANDADNRVPALVFCFNRDECWEVAERMKGLPLISGPTRNEIDAYLAEHKDDFVDGVGPKLKQMLIRGVGVHHAGILPKHKTVVETLFNKKLVPFVICTETLAAGINLPARSVVLSTLLKGKRGDKKLVPSATAHQIFGRAGRPQFDSKGYVYVLAHEDDARLVKWKKKYDQIDPNSKDPGIMRARKDLERKRPTRRKTEQYWSEGQFKQLIEAGPAKLFSRSMIPYSVLIYLLTKTGTLDSVRGFLSRRFNTAERIAGFNQQLDFMIQNLASLGYLTHSSGTVEGEPPGPEKVTLQDTIYRLLNFRSIDPLYGAFLTEILARSNYHEKVLALESVLEIPPNIVRHVGIPDYIPPGPLQTEVVEPLLIQAGVLIANVAVAETQTSEGEGVRGRVGEGASGRFKLARPDDEDEYAEEEEEPLPPTFPELLALAFGTKLAAPEPINIQPKWIGGGVAEIGNDFFKFVRSRELIKQEGLILRHLLRLVILAGEFHSQTQDPDYAQLAESATAACRHVEPRYTEHFLKQAEEAKKIATV